MDSKTTTDLTSTEVRKVMQKMLQQDAKYLRVKEDDKTPTSSFAIGRRNRLKRIPATGNYGIIPANDLFILDFDNHRKNADSVEKQITFFSVFFDMDIRQSFSVSTPNGGVHVYLRLPPGIIGDSDIKLPKASLRPYSAAFSAISEQKVLLDADMRTSLTNSYVIGPSSNITDHGNYEILEGNGFHGITKILTISEKAATQLSNVVKFHYETLNKKNEHTYNTNNTNKIHVKPDTMSVFAIRYALDKKGYTTYHQKRAFIKALLHCCYDDYAISLTCIELGIDKDTYTEKSIGFKQLIQDVSRFSPKNCFHNKYCSIGKEQFKHVRDVPSKKYENNDIEQYIERMKSKKQDRKISRITSGYREVNPRVLDTAKISHVLIGNSRKKKPSQQYHDSMAIVDYFLQPLSNIGNIRILLAHAALSEKLELSPSRVTQAMRLLRERDIISIVQKQRTGLAATYSVSEDYTHTYLTKSLKTTWANSVVRDDYIKHDSLYFDRADKTFRKVFGNDKVSAVQNIENIVKRMNDNMVDSSFHDFSAGAAVSYLKEEAASHEFYDELSNNEPVDEYDEVFDNKSGDMFIHVDNRIVNTVTGEVFFTYNE